MKVLLISDNRCRENIIPFPLGIASIAAAARQAGHDISCLDLMFSTDPAADTVESVREPVAVADELASLEADYGVGTAAFVDSLFNYPPGYTRELCREIAARRLSLRWIANLNPLYCDRETMELMRLAGCVGMSIGNESGSEDILLSLKKGFTREEVIGAVRDAKGLGFRINCFLLLGGPGENEKTVEESVRLMLELEPDMVSVTVGIRIYPGCEMHDIALREGVVEPGQNLLYPAFYLSRETEPWLHAYMREICDAHEGWVL